MAVQLTSGLVSMLQLALFKAGYYPGLMTNVFDDNTVNQLEAYWRSKGWALPQSADAATALLRQSFMESGTQDPAFTLSAMTSIGMAYVEKRGLGGAGGWLRRNWPWLVGGVVVAAGVVGGGYYLYTHREGAPMGELGCGCGLGGR